MATSVKRRLLSRDSYAVAILCPLEVELSAIRCMMDEEHERLPPAAGDSHCYTLGQLSGHNVVVASLPAGYQGKVSATIVVNGILKSFPSISLRLLVGIAGGIPSTRHDVRLGDVVISTPSGDKGGVVEYDLGKSTITGFERKGYLCPPPAEWLTVLGQMQSDHRIHGSSVSQFISDMLERYPQLIEYSRPPDSTDVLFDSKYHHISQKSTCEDCDRSQVVERPVREIFQGPRVHYGLIASGDRVIKDASEREKISTSLDDVLCFEMEAAGLMNNFRCIVIRGISDYADSHKNDVWQPYAAVAAAGVAKELLGYKHSITESLPAPVDMFEVFKNAYSSLSRLEILRISGASLPMDGCYINLSIIRVSQGKKQSSSQDRESRQWSRKEGQGPNIEGLMSLNHLFHPIKDSQGNLKPVKRILIQGHAGVGKTTLCKKIVNEFLNSNMWHDMFDWVVWIPLRRLKQSPDVSSYSLGDFLYDEYFSQCPDGKSLALKAWEMVEGKDSRRRCLFLLDGLDEVWHEWETGTAMDRFLRHILEMPSVIVTTRPYSSGQHFVKNIDLEAETIGFKREQIFSYINNPEIIQDESVAEDISNFLRGNPQLARIFQIPIQLDAMCYSWNNKVFSDAPKTMTSIYQEVVLKLWQKDLVRLQKKWNERKITEETAQYLQDYDIEEIASKEVEIVETLAFNGLYNSLVDFQLRDRTQIYQYLIHNKKGSLRLCDQIIENLSFLRSNNPKTGSRDYHFLHLTFQEYFAARYFVRHWICSQDIHHLALNGTRPQSFFISPFSFLQQEKYNPRYRIFWKFTAGLLYAGWSQGTPTRDPLDSFFECLDSEPQDLLGPSHQHLVASCLRELPEPETLSTLQNGKRLEARLFHWMFIEPLLFNTHNFTSSTSLPDRLLPRFLDSMSEDLLPWIIMFIKKRPYIPMPILQRACSWLQNSGSNKSKIAAFTILVYHHDSLASSVLQTLTYTIRNAHPDMAIELLESVKDFESLPEPILHCIVDLVSTSNEKIRDAAQVSLKIQSNLPKTIIHRIALLIGSNSNDLSKFASECTGFESTPSLETFRLLRKMAINQDKATFDNVCVFLKGIRYNGFPDEFVEDLLQSLGDTDKRVRQRATRMLGFLVVKREQIYDSMFLLIRDNEEDVRDAAIHALFSGKCPPERLIRSMLLLLEEEDKQLKISFLNALSFYVHKSKGCLPEMVIDSMIGLLSNDDYMIRYGALEVIIAYSSIRFQDFHIGRRILFHSSACEVFNLDDKPYQPMLICHILKALNEYFPDDGRNKLDFVTDLIYQYSMSPCTFQNINQVLRESGDDVNIAMDAIAQTPDLPYEILESLVHLLGVGCKLASNILSRQGNLPDEICKSVFQVLISGPSTAKASAILVLVGHDIIKDTSDTLVSLFESSEGFFKYAIAETLMSRTDLPTKVVISVLSYFKEMTRMAVYPREHCFFVVSYLMRLDQLPLLLIHMETDSLGHILHFLTMGACIIPFRFFVDDGKFYVQTSQGLGEAPFESPQHEAEFRCRIQDAQRNNVTTQHIQ